MPSTKRAEDLRKYIEGIDNALLIAAKCGVFDGTPDARVVANHVRLYARTPEGAEQTLRWRNGAAERIGEVKRDIQYYLDHKDEARITYSRSREDGGTGMFTRLS